MIRKKFSSKYFELIKIYQTIHKSGISGLSPDKTFAGRSLKKWIVILKFLIQKNKCKSVLDFGCGKAVVYNRPLIINNKKYQKLIDYWGCENITLYDPAVNIYSRYPTSKADMVICTDVLEHIDPYNIDTFIENLFALTNKVLFIVVATVPASKVFEDGTNIHLTIKTENQWNNLFEKFKTKYPNIKLKLKFNG